MFTFEVDTSELDRAVAEELPKLEKDIQDGGMAAARAGIKAAQAKHPYKDRTGDLTGHAEAVEDTVAGGGIMMWPEEYAGFVDKGTTRSKPYPFTPLAEKVATEMDKIYAENAVDAFKAKMER